MGYKSDVRIVTSKQGYKELLKCVDKYYKDNNIPKEHQYILLNNLDVDISNKYQKYFGWNFIKWNSYEDKNAIEHSLKILQEKGFSYRYSRIGESYNDYEEDYFDSPKEKNLKLKYPEFERYFNDKYIEKLLREQIIKNDNLER